MNYWCFLGIVAWLTSVVLTYVWSFDHGYENGWAARSVDAEEKRAAKIKASNKKFRQQTELLNLVAEQFGLKRK